MSEKRKCPVTGATGQGNVSSGPRNRDWWPNRLNLKMFHQNPAVRNPMGEGFDYPEEFKKLDLEALKKDLYSLMSDSQDGGQLITGIRDLYLSVWHGTVPARTVWVMGVVVQDQVASG